MTNNRKMLSAAISALIMTSFSATAIAATDTLFSNTPQSPKIDYMLAYADKSESSKDSSHGSHGEMKYDKKGYKHSKMSDVDLDGDGKISKDEFIKHHEKMFEKKDLNKDGFIDEDEMKKMKKMHGHGHGHGHGKDYEKGKEKE